MTEEAVQNQDSNTASTPGRSLKLGQHLSTTNGWGGLVEQAKAHDNTAFAFFPRSPYGRESKKLKSEDPAPLVDAQRTLGWGPLVAHAPYVYNLAGKDAGKRAFAITSMQEDAQLLATAVPEGGTIYFNFHPGSHVGQGMDTGIRLIADGLKEVLPQVPDSVQILLETMAGKGTEVGSKFEELAAIIAHLDAEAPDVSARVGVTLDTCHVYDAGYDVLQNLTGVLAEFNEVVGLNRLKALHINDSKFGFQSHKDRHAPIGLGELGVDFFGEVVNNPTLKKLPMVLETPPRDDDVDEVALLRGLAE
ncbi:MAG: deoxyribonuclease IV [Bifidobacteriaceae bacterium]|jgi:deoxyribonuclease-4|nr:deoxyribonuclease IV [Bifidobacteriaceae bacterium]